MDLKTTYQAVANNMILNSGVARRMIEMWHSSCAREKIVRGFRGVRSERIQRTERSRN